MENPGTIVYEIPDKIFRRNRMDDLSILLVYCFPVTFLLILGVYVILFEFSMVAVPLLILGLLFLSPIFIGIPLGRFNRYRRCENGFYPSNKPIQDYLLNRHFFIPYSEVKSVRQRPGLSMEIILRSNRQIRIPPDSMPPSQYKYLWKKMENLPIDFIPPNWESIHKHCSRRGKIGK